MTTLVRCRRFKIKENRGAARVTTTSGPRNGVHWLDGEYFDDLDWLLTSNQKTYIKGMSESIWIWLSDQHSRSYIESIFSRLGQNILTGYFAVSLVLSATLVVSISIWFNIFIIEAFIVAFGYLAVAAFARFSYLPKVYKVITEGGSRGARAYIRKLAVKTGAISFSIATFWLILEFFLIYFTGLDYIIYFLLLTAAVGFMLGCLITLPFNLIIFSIIWSLLIILIMVLFKTLEFFMLRIAMHEKGPLLGLSAGLVAIGAVLKSVG